ncbi:MAG: SpoIIE family protein phosphatase [Oscillospiraceae bacterium]|nr:SpoIIE family protein phosphatase [Oscillospiraceae bacterium]
MKKFKHIVLGGIQQKVFNLVLVTILLMIAAYTAVVLHQSGALSRIVSQTSESQKESISTVSRQTMDAVLNVNMTQDAQTQAYIMQDYFGDAARVVKMLADYSQHLLEDPRAYSPREAAPPDPALDGQISLQLLTEEGVDPTEPAVAEKLALMANLGDMMKAIYADANVDSCYAALPEGVMLLTDDHAASKFDENGELMSIAISTRPWYLGALERGGLYFTDVTTDHFSGKISIMCAMPVYLNGRPAAVIGADLFLEDMAAAVEKLSQNGGFLCIINEKGHVVFSGRDRGSFRVRPPEEALDLRASENTELGSFVCQALTGTTELRLIEVDGEPCYMTGAPVENVGWTVLNVVPKSLADQPTEEMLRQYDEAQGLAVTAYNQGLSSAKTTIIVLLIAVAVIGLGAALVLAKRIVRPLELITKRVGSLGGSDLQFKMEKAFRTGDEIEVLAESFAAISGKTLQYIDKVQQVTAEKERISTELSLATRIQADMLPNIYPAFPDRPDFDIYAVMDPAKEVGGDFYDFFLVDEDHLCMTIADVSGKGVPAALFMMASKIMLANYAKLGKSPAEILTETNKAICSNNREEMFVTVWLGILELSTGKLTAANAGHEYPVLCQPGARFELVKDKHGLVVGGMEGVRYREYELNLAPGAKLFLYTDGVPEATNAEAELFGSQRMLEALNSELTAVPEQVLRNVRRAVDGFVREAEQFDDLTMLCLEYRGKAGQGEAQ